MFNPLDYILKGAKAVVNQGKSAVAGFLDAPDNSTKGIVKNTIMGIAPAAKDLVLPTRGYTETELKKAKPTFKDQVVGTGKGIAEISSGLGQLGSMGANYLPGYSSVIDKLAKTKVGGKLADTGQALSDFSRPDTVGQAKAMRVFDVASNFLPVGSVKNLGTASKVIAASKDVNIITKELLNIGVKKQMVAGLAPKLVEMTDPKQISNLLSSELSKLSLADEAIAAAENRGKGLPVSQPNTDVVRDTVSRELSNLDTKPLTINGQPDLSNTDVQFRLSQLQDTVNKRALTDTEIKEAKDLLNQVGVSTETPHLKFDADGRPLAYNARERAIANEAIPNESRFEATKENFQEPKLEALPEATPNLPKLDLSPEEVVKRSQLESSYKESVQRPIKDASQAKKYYNEDTQIYKEMTDLESFPTQRKEINTFAKEINLPKKVDNYEDISNINKGFKDVFRNFEQVFKKEFPVIKSKILDPFDASKGQFIDMQKAYLKDLDTNIIKRLGIKKGSEESKWLMRFGEKRATYEEVAKNLGRKKADNIVEADKWFRETYNDLIDEVNKVRKQIYPTNSEKIIPKRQDYYRHFTEMTGDLSGLKNIFETPAGIDPKLAGLSPFTQPKSKWASFMQKRTGAKTTEDAVGGFLDYLPSASYSIHIDPNIGRFRALADNLRNSTKGNLNNFIDFLDKFANDLSGKTSSLDRIVTDFVPGGRKTLRALDWVNRRIKANTILANVSSSIAQIFNVPQGISSAKQYSAKGLVDTLADVIRPNKAIQESSFIKERYFRGYDKFDTGILNNTKKFAAWMIGALDQVGTKFIWNSHYEKALAQNIPNPVKYADDITRKMVAGRGIGEVPLVQKSKVFQMVAPFQLEVTNLWYVMSEFVSKKDFGALVILFTANYFMNQAAEEIRGSAVTFDPIRAVADAYKQVSETPDKGKGALLATGRVAGEVLSNLPLGQTVASAYPEFGFKVGDAKAPTRKQLFGRSDPTRFGAGILASKGIKDPLYSLLPSYGGSQIKKTVQGVQALKEGGSFDKGGNLQFETGNPLKTILFGKYSTADAREYFDKADIKTSAENKVLPVYLEAQKLKESGKQTEADALVDSLSDEDWEIYKGLKTKDKRTETLKMKKKVLPIFQKAQKLKAEGKQTEADALVESLSEEEWNAYKLLKAQLEN